MKLYTQAQLDQLYRNGSPLHSGEDHYPVIKLFTPDAQCTWLITEISDHENLFGLCDLGFGCPELGYVSIEELKNLRGHLRLPVERDLFFETEYPISVYNEAARWNQCITFNKSELQQAIVRLQKSQLKNKLKFYMK